MASTLTSWGCTFAESLKRREELLPLISKWSPEALVGAEAPPIYFEYDWGLTKPDDIKETNYLVHSPRWGLGFQKMARDRGAVCYVRVPRSSLGEVRRHVGIHGEGAGGGLLNGATVSSSPMFQKSCCAGGVARPVRQSLWLPRRSFAKCRQLESWHLRNDTGFRVSIKLTVFAVVTLFGGQGGVSPFPSGCCPPVGAIRRCNGTTIMPSDNRASGPPQGGTDFEFDLADPLFNQIRECLETVVPVSMIEENILRIAGRPGVYLLIHRGTPVYVGKADDSVRSRLSRHLRTLSGRRNISLADMTFKSVCFAKTWDPFKPEDHLIRHHRTNRGEGWNDRGFGSNEPGVNRGKTELSRSNFYRRFPLDDRWVCTSIESGEFRALPLLRSVKSAVPFFFKFQGNRTRGEEAESQQKVEEARRDYAATLVQVPHSNMTARDLLSLVAQALPHGWQATITPSHMLLYKEVNEVYPYMEIIWPVQNQASSQ